MSIGRLVLRIFVVICGLVLAEGGVQTGRPIMVVVGLGHVFAAIFFSTFRGKES